MPPESWWPSRSELAYEPVLVALGVLGPVGGGSNLAKVVVGDASRECDRAEQGITLALPFARKIRSAVKAVAFRGKTGLPDIKLRSKRSPPPRPGAKAGRRRLGRA